MFPTSQGQLIRTARGQQSQVEFAKLLKVNRSSLSRYESEQLGAPTSVLNYCLRAVVGAAAKDVLPDTPVQRALLLARQAVSELEQAEAKPSIKRAAKASRARTP